MPLNSLLADNKKDNPVCEVRKLKLGKGNELLIRSLHPPTWMTSGLLDSHIG